MRRSPAVVRGSKRFLVAPPGTVEDERSYLHPHFRRSRSLAAADDQEVVAAGFEAVDLDAGDVLVLPAYWWHQVSTVDGFSISVNAWKRPPPVEKRWRREAARRRAPFGANWARGDTIAVLERLLETLVAGVLSGVDARAWLRRSSSIAGDLPGIAAPAAADASFEDEDAGFEDEDAGFEDERWNATPADAAVGAAPVGRVATASEL
ncbi:tRNA-Phe hydroxylase [Aureococcus anophagefferens]|nr:tRNA-Phe hydroxylase [Aureococcus anophagefferens]